MTRRGHPGFALVNALIMVGALAAVVVGLMQIASASRNRARLAQEVAQARLYLDAAEALALVQIGLGEVLPRGDAPLRIAAPVDRGEAAVEIADLQARFNVNWLVNEDDTEARAAFDRLLLLLGLPATLGAEIAAYLGPDAAQIAGAYAIRKVPVRPPGDVIALTDELRIVRGMTDAAFARLAPHITAFRGESTLNANTVTAPVMAAFLPGVPVTEAAGFLRSRARVPYPSTEEFAAAATARFGVDAAPAIARFGVGSVWFEARLSASLGETRLGRRIIVSRDPNARTAAVVYRLPGAD